MQRKKKPLPDWGRGFKEILFYRFFYSFNIDMALLACSSVIPSYELVKIKCATWESRITYSSSLITYLVSYFPCSDAIKLFLAFFKKN